MNRRVNEHSIALAREWRRLGRAATAVAVFTSPALFVALYDRFEWPLPWALLGTLIGIAAFRGLVDVLAHKLIPAPSLIMNRSGGGVMDQNPFAATLADGEKRPLVAALLGQAFVVAYQTVLQNRDATDRVAQQLIMDKELYGDDVTSLLDGVGLRKPSIDVLEESTWPAI